MSAKALYKFTGISFNPKTQRNAKFTCKKNQYVKFLHINTVAYCAIFSQSV